MRFLFTDDGSAMSVSVEPRDLTYPDKPDANGYAKKYYKRRAFYFGMHNTPESFALFGEWKRQLMETGEAPEVKAIRRDLAHTARATEQSKGEPRSQASFLICAAMVSASILGATQIVASNQLPVVDGVPLTPHEINLVRGTRTASKVFEEERHNAETVEREVELAEKVLAKAPRQGQIPPKLHTSKGLSEELTQTETSASR